MQPISVQVPAEQCAAIAAEVQRKFDDGDQGAMVRVWIGPALELVLSMDAADRLADALVDAIAVDDEKRPVLFPVAAGGRALVGGW